MTKQSQFLITLLNLATYTIYPQRPGDPSGTHFLCHCTFTTGLLD